MWKYGHLRCASHGERYSSVSITSIAIDEERYCIMLFVTCFAEKTAAIGYKRFL